MHASTHSQVLVALVSRSLPQCEARPLAHGEVWLLQDTLLALLRHILQQLLKCPVIRGLDKPATW
jgi:hypothetical protein